MTLLTLKKRPEFLAIRGGVKASSPAFLIEAKASPARVALVERTSAQVRPGPAPADPGKDKAQSPPRFGFTVTKKLGSAVIRNRIRRRLKAAVAAVQATHARAGYDYVVVARKAAFDRAFETLVADVERALGQIHKPAKPSSPPPSHTAPQRAPRRAAQPPLPKAT